LLLMPRVRRWILSLVPKSSCPLKQQIKQEPPSAPLGAVQEPKSWKRERVPGMIAEGG
jgi:hypothetical protein